MSDRLRDLEVQREVTRMSLACIEGFALAGSGAIREHGLTSRPTEDVDLFTTVEYAATFADVVDRVADELRREGFEVDHTRHAERYARLHVIAADSVELDVDFGVDWREADPVESEIGPILSLADAVGNKVSALYSRGEARDYLDVDAIRSSGRFDDFDLVRAASKRDLGFEVGRFVLQLAAVSFLDPAQVAPYGVSAEELDAVKGRCLAWAEALASAPPT